MVRPTFLIAEPKPQEGISARKLVLETALYNVITAYDGPGALELLEKFPNVDSVIVHSGLGERDYKRLIDMASTTKPGRMIVLISPTPGAHHPAAQYHLSSHDPKQLLDLLLEHHPLPDFV